MRGTVIKESISFSSKREIFDLFTACTKNLKMVEDAFQIKLVARGEDITLIGTEEKVLHSKKALNQLIQLFERGYIADDSDLKFVLRNLVKNKVINVEELFSERIYIPSEGKYITPKTETQKKYIKAIKSNDVVLAIGPAGTGKTYLAVAVGVSYFSQRKVKRIILVRPAVEAGEKLGYLPGTIYDKIDPYLRPLYDALYDILDPEKVERLMDRRQIEIAPMAYMRGRTLNDAFIILDEAQNTTPTQMKMFLTRLGFGSKAVITGDITQIDLPKGVQSGLIHAQKVLKSIEGIEFVYFNESDVVRHNLVQKIIKAYEEAEAKEKI